MATTPNERREAFLRSVSDLADAVTALRDRMLSDDPTLQGIAAAEELSRLLECHNPVTGARFAIPTQETDAEGRSIWKAWDACSREELEADLWRRAERLSQKREELREMSARSLAEFGTAPRGPDWLYDAPRADDPEQRPSQ